MGDEGRGASEARGADDGAAGSVRKEVGWVPNFPRVRRLDEQWYRAECVVCGVMFLLMAITVALAVVADVFSTRRDWYYPLALLGFVLLATRTYRVRDGATRMGWAACVGVSLALTAVISGAVYLYIEVFPGGFLWAQKLALVMMLWVALLGASMATYERAHLALEMGEKLWPRQALHLARAMAHALTSAFCILMFAVSVRMLLWHLGQDTEIEGNDWLPTWLAVAIIPYTFGALSIRFLAQTYTVASRQEAPREEQIPT